MIIGTIILPVISLFSAPISPWQNTRHISRAVRYLFSDLIDNLYVSDVYLFPFAVSYY